MLIHVAENGQSFELECQPTSCVELVQSRLASLTQVPSHDQLLICGDIRLEPQRTLRSYNLPFEERHVFLFNRARLMVDSPPPPVEQLNFIEPVIPPPPPASLGSHPLDEASDPALKALPSYERQFKFHFQKGHAIFSASQSKFEVCRRLLREQQVQNMALETAKGNMDHYYKIINQMYGEFIKHFNRQQKQHADLLDNFEREIERLRVCKLHPTLLSENRRNLVDCIKEGNLLKSAENCAISHKQFQTKVSQLKAMYSELQRNVEGLFDFATVVNIHQIEEVINNHLCYVEEEASIMQSLSKDVNTVKKLVDDCVSCQFSASLRPHDAVSALGPMYDVHDKNNLPRMEACSKEIGKLLEYCRTRKREMSLYVHGCMQRVAALQSGIRDMRNQLSAFKEAMAHQDEIFSDLKLLRRIGPAYKACLAEVVRRKAGVKLYMGQAGQLAEKLARKRDLEIVRREEFVRLQSVYIPQDILGAMGLFDVPSQCVVNIAPYDTKLLDIDIKDLERYAPDSVVGSFSKEFGIDQSLQARNTFSPSGSSANSGGVEEPTVSMKGTFETEIIEDDNSDEIAGTSRLEVENAWLKAELASTVAILCNLNPNLEQDLIGDADDCKAGNFRRNAVQKTAEALRLKDEHVKHLENMLKTRQLQCNAYEKRIRDLEERLSGQYMEFQKLSSPQCSLDLGAPLSSDEGTISKSEASGVTREDKTPCAVVPPELMDGISSSTGLEMRQCSSSNRRKTTVSDHGCKFQEGSDEAMSEFLGGTMPGDAALLESHSDKLHDFEKCANKDQFNLDTNLGARQLPGSSSDVIHDGNEHVAAKGPVTLLKEKDKQLSALQEMLEKKSGDFVEAEKKLNAALDDVTCLRAELEGNEEFLSECQMNCAHLENRLHEAREEARTNLCAADRRAVEYNALRASSVKLCGLVERLRHCISAPQAGNPSLVEPLRMLAISLGSDENGDAENAEFRACLKVLAERVGWLAQERAELLERCSRAEAAHNQLAKELENKTELLKNLYAKRKIDKQVIREKICFSRIEVHELAVFIPNTAGQYEAVNHNCPHYFLSDESVSLFLQHMSSGQQYIVGQIVHIERNVTRLLPQSNSQSANIMDISGTNVAAASGSRSRSNSYGLPVGTEYFVVTLAMVPDYMPAKLG